MATNPFTAARIGAITDRLRATTKQQLIDITNQKTAEHLTAFAAAFGGQTTFRRYVDGQLGKALTDVDPAGFTLTQFDVLGPIIDAAFKMLIERSPYGPDAGGHYRDDHWLFVNETRRESATEGAPVQVNSGDKIVIVNTRPYAAKIEGGAIERRRRRLTNRRPGLSVQAPNGVYEISARDLQRQFGNLALIEFTYRGVVDGAAPEPGGAGHARAHNKARDRFPALTIELIG